MLIAAGQRHRSWATIFLVVLYALGILAPCATLAIAKGAGGTHCSPGIADTRVVPDSAQHHMDDLVTADLDRDGRVDDRGWNCCEAMCAQVLPTALLDIMIEPQLSTKAPSYPQRGLASAGPQRLHRPPISPQSL